MSARFVLVLAVLLLAHCAPPPDPNKGLDQAVPVVLSPDSWMRKYKIEKSSGILVFALDMAAPGAIRVEGMPAGRNAWIEVRERGLRLARSESLHVVAGEDLQPGRRVFVFVPTDVFREFPQEIALVYDPAWSAAEEEIGAVERVLRAPDADMAALFERLAGARARLGEPGEADSNWTDELRARSARLNERIATALLEERLAEAYAAIDRGDWDRAGVVLRMAEDGFVRHVSGAQKDEFERRIVRAGKVVVLAERAREADRLSAQQWQGAEESGRLGAHEKARQEANAALASAREAQQLWIEVQAGACGPMSPLDGFAGQAGMAARLENLQGRIEEIGAWIGVWDALLGTQEQVREWSREIVAARGAIFAAAGIGDLRQRRGRMLEVVDEVERRMAGMVDRNIRREYAWEGFRQVDAALAEVGEQARESARVLGLAIVKSGTDPVRLDRAGARELIGYHRLAGELLAAGLPESEAGLVEQARALFERRIVEQAEKSVDALAERGEWARAEDTARYYRSFFPGEVNRLELELALRKAEHFLQIAQADSVRLFSQRALENYRTARATLEDFVDFSVDAKVHYDIAAGAIERIERRNLEVLELTVEKRTLKEVIGSSQLPLKFPIFIVIGKERFGIEGADAGNVVFNYDIELIIPEEDFARLEIRPQTAVEDPKKPIRTIVTRRYDGKVSYVLKTSDFTRPSAVRIAVDGGEVDIEAIAENWIIRLGKQM